MLEGKLARIKALLETKEKVDTELNELIGGIARPKRGRPAKEKAPGEPEASLGGT